MNKIKSFCGITISVALIIIFLISSFEIAMYVDFSFYRKEYEKYNILSELDMEMDDVMYVTEEMMAYLRGDRDRLSVITVVDGEKQDFFNEQNRFHMWEVQKLFIGGLNLRKMAVSVMAIGIFLLVFCLKRQEALTYKNINLILCKGYQRVTAILAVLIVGILATVIIDFDAAFTVFHKLFFDNEFWLFDPAKDYMIRMLPQGLFYDFVIRISTVFLLTVAVGFIVSMVIKQQNK